MEFKFSRKKENSLTQNLRRNRIDLFLEISIACNKLLGYRKF